MIRRLALILALLSPVAALAQTAGSVLMVPAAFGLDDCTDTDNSVLLSWTTAQAIVEGDFYKVYVSNSPPGGSTPACTTSAVATGTKIGIDFPALTTTQNFVGSNTRAQFIADSGAYCTAGATAPTIWVCVQHTRGTVIQAVMSGSAPLYLKPPPQPVNVTVGPGDTALYVSWDKNPVANGVPTSSYEVNAVASSPPNPADEHIQAFTGLANNRVTGLTNGVTYSVTVKSVSPGSNKSAATDEVYGTPEPVAGFWEQYHAIPGREQGGCTGGPAGLIALLGVALALGSFWRRS